MATKQEIKIDQDKDKKDAEISKVVKDVKDGPGADGHDDQGNKDGQEDQAKAKNGKDADVKDMKEESGVDGNVDKDGQKDQTKTANGAVSEMKDTNGNTDSKPGTIVEKKETDDKSTEDTAGEDESDDLDLEEIVNDADRNTMFEKAVKLDKAGDKNKALKCYLKCLVGLTERTQFPLLPQCLRNISDIYHGKDEYEKAISFMQAEKMYYESVLISETDLQKQLEEISKDSQAASGDANIDLLRASEYEQLAKLCNEEKQPHLALEYAGKATKLRQNVYSDDHPVVQESLNYFTALYAEAGKAMYAENLKKYEEVGPPDLSSLDENDEPPSPSTEPSSILRKRKSTEGDREKRVRFDESQFIAPHEVTEREEKMARTVLLLLFITLLIVVIVLGLYIYCYINPSLTCSSFKLTLRDCVMRAKYWYYYYISGVTNKYV